MRTLCTLNVIIQHAKKCPPTGSVIECGVYDGVTSMHIRLAAGNKHNQYAADTFAGMPYDGNDLEKSGGFVKGHLAPENRENTLQTLRAQGIQPLVGMVEDTLADVKDESFAFAFLDLDLEKPTRFATEFLMPRIVVGGIIGFHDYFLEKGYVLAGVSETVHELLRDNPEWEMLECRSRTIFFRRIK